MLLLHFPSRRRRRFCSFIISGVRVWLKYLAPNASSQQVPIVGNGGHAGRPASLKTARREKRIVGSGRENIQQSSLLGCNRLKRFGQICTNNRGISEPIGRLAMKRGSGEPGSDVGKCGNQFETRARWHGSVERKMLKNK